MSSRTSEASKAISEAWKQEKERVLEGKETRDWTPEQQQDIIEKGKAYDEYGKAFHGQHMKSVEKYPEFQGYADNIQFLTQKEHLAAHRGKWTTLQIGILTLLLVNLLISGREFIFLVLLSI